MAPLDQDHAAFRCRYDSTKPLNQISVMAAGPDTVRAYIYEMTETILPAPANFGKTVALNFVAMLEAVGATYVLTPNMKYYIVGVSDGGLLAHEKLFQQVVLAAPNIVTFSDPPGVIGGSTSSIILTIDGTMPG